MRTADEKDLERLRIKYGEDVVRSIVKADTGTGMVENPSYNKGMPYFVSFRPLMHSTTRLSDADLAKYDDYNRMIDDMRYQIEQLEEEKIDVFELKLELDLALEKLKIGKFDMVDIYLESIETRLKKYWEELGKRPKRKELKLAKLEDIRKSVNEARLARRQLDAGAIAARRAMAQAVLMKARMHGMHAFHDPSIESSLLVALAYARKGFKTMIISQKNPKQLGQEYNVVGAETYWLTPEPGKMNVSPKNAQQIYSACADFITRNNKSVIIFDGLGTIRDAIGTDNMLTMLRYIRPRLASKEVMMLIPLTVPNWQQVDLIKLSRETDVIAAPRVQPQQSMQGQNAQNR